MGHPQVIDPRHPLIERVRGLCFELPEVVEVEAWGRPTFRAAKPIFVHVAATQENPLSIVVKTDPEGPPLPHPDSGPTTCERTAAKCSSTPPPQRRSNLARSDEPTAAGLRA